MSKLFRNTSDEVSRKFWEGVEKGAAEIEGAPQWMKAGINLNERHFHTYARQNTGQVIPEDGDANEAGGAPRARVAGVSP